VIALTEEVRLAARLAGDGALSSAADAAQAAGAAFLRGVAAEHGLKGGDEEPSGRLLEKAPESAPAELAALEAALAAATAAQEVRAWEADLRSLHSRAAALGHDAAEILKPAPATARWVAWGR